MKYVSVSVLVFGWSLCFGQGVRFQLYRTGPCTTVEKLYTGYYLESTDETDTSFYPKNGITYLPGKGRYRIIFEPFYGPLANYINIKDTGLTVYKYREPDVGRYEGGVDASPVYRCCGELIDGYFEYYYPNGRLKIRGNFISGHPKDSLTTFYSNGAAEEREHIYKKTITRELFDSLRHKILFGEYQRGPVIIYRWHKTTFFFTDGKVMRKESDKRSIQKVNEYYPNGQIKIEQTTKHRLEFYENGRPKVTYTWKKYIDRVVPPEKGTKDFVVSQTNYDQNGEISQTIIFEVHNVFGLPPKLEFDEYDWIVRLTKYNDGKVVFEIKDMDAKECLEKYGDKNKQ